MSKSKKGKKGLGTYATLKQQVEAIFRHAKGVSKFSTKPAYKRAVDQYIKFVAREFRLQKFLNTKPKHIRAWVEDMKVRGLAPGTIRNYLSALRWCLDNSGWEGRFPSNEELGLTKRKTVGIDRAWTDEEFEKMLSIAAELGRYDVIDAMILARFMGLRLHEVVRLDRVQAEKLLRRKKASVELSREEAELFLKVKGKGGLVREVPIPDVCLEVLERRLEITPRGGKLFVPKGKKAKDVMKSIENFILYHRSKVQDEDRLSPKEQVKMRQERKEYRASLTFHGLRHSFVQDLERQLASEGLERDEAWKRISRIIGHRRRDAVRPYSQW